MRPAHLVLEDGTVFAGRAVGAPGLAAGEACFTTSMAGYEEAVTDPSYAAQVLTFTYPLVGNYGVDPARMESAAVHTRGVVMRRARPAFAGWLAGEGVVALEEVDTRALVRRMREDGAMRCALGEAPVEELLVLARSEPHIDVARHEEGESDTPNLAFDVMVERAVQRRLRPAPRRPRLRLQALDRAPPRGDGARGDGRPRGLGGGRDPRARAAARCSSATGRATRRSSPGRSRRCARSSDGCPSSGSASAISCSGSRSAWRRSSCRSAIAAPTIRCGCAASSRVLVTVQNHGFAVAPRTQPRSAHVSLNDGTCEGLEGDGFASVQFHPEAAPGPLDAASLLRPDRRGMPRRDDLERSSSSAPGLSGSDRPRSSTTPAPRPAACCAPRATGSCS